MASTMSYISCGRFKQCEGNPKVVLRCPFDGCSARIFASAKEELLARSTKCFNPPQMVTLSNDADTTCNNEYLMIQDVWDFDNIGVSKPSIDSCVIKFCANDRNGQIRLERLLTCSECDKGPIGFAGHSEEETDVQKLLYFLSCSSVLYDVKS